MASSLNTQGLFIWKYWIKYMAVFFIIAGIIMQVQGRRDIVVWASYFLGIFIFLMKLVESRRKRKETV